MDPELDRRLERLEELFKEHQGLQATELDRRLKEHQRLQTTELDRRLEELKEQLAALIVDTAASLHIQMQQGFERIEARL